jgi:hypothetical protein
MQGRFGANALALALLLGGCAVTPVPDVNTFAEDSANNSFEVFDRRMAGNALVLPVVHAGRALPLAIRSTRRHRPRTRRAIRSPRS